MNTEHTPIPWRAYRDGDNWMIEVRDSDRNGGVPNLRSVIAILRNAGLCPEHGGSVSANANFIVHACNAYDKMLEALKLALEMLEAACEENDPAACTQMEWESLEPIRAAIAKAEEINSK